jgi:tRNA (guanine10-N2)-dimethyltransferase
MLLAFELSGEHETIPKAEVLSCLKALKINHEELLSLDRLLLVKTNTDETDAERISERLAMTHYVSKVLGICEAKEEEMLGMVSRVDIDPIEDFAVRAHVRDGSFSSTELERKIGHSIKERGYRVNLRSPERVFRVIIVSGLCIFSSLLYSIDRSQYEHRRPHLRPFFFPGVLTPRIARAVVNLSQIDRGILLDPFCGTGGILIEAGYIGAELIGVDIQRKMVMGTRENLKFHGFSALLLIGDACEMGIMDDCIDAVVTDLPYGRSSFIKADSIPDLYGDALNEVYRVLKEHSFAVIISDSPLKDVIQTSFKIIDRHAYRVHKSLTRYITILMKP